MEKGKVKTLHSDKGFGFIKAETGKEYFFHRTGMMNKQDFDDLRVGDVVEFDTEETAKGPRAVDVERV